MMTVKNDLPLSQGHSSLYKALPLSKRRPKKKKKKASSEESGVQMFLSAFNTAWESRPKAAKKTSVKYFIQIVLQFANL